MASAGTWVNEEFTCDCPPKLIRCRQEAPRPPITRRGSAQVSSAWTLEKKHGGPSSHRPPVLSHVSITPSPPQTPPRHPHETLTPTLVFHRLLIHQRPEDRRPSSGRCPPLRPFLTGAMTSSLIDQFPLPSAAGEPTDIRRPPTVSPKRSPDVSRPPLVTNSFLRPAAAKVPFPPPRDKNQMSPHAGAKSASWRNGENVPTINPHSIITGNSSIPGDVAAVPYRGVQLTEAVRRLAGRRLDIHPKPVYPKDEALDDNPPPAFPPGPRNTVGSLTSEHCLNDHNGNAWNPGNRPISSLLTAADRECNNLGTEPSGVMAAPPPPASRETAQPVNVMADPPPPASRETAQPVNVMASQISTIHLHRTCVRESPGQSDAAAHVQHVLVPRCDPDCGEEELPEGLEDSPGEEEDDEDPDDPSLIRVTSAASGSPRDSASSLGPPSAIGDVTMKPALTPSLFPNLPPTLYFSTQDEKVELLPWAQRKLLKWKMSTVTPNIVKQAVARSHFRVTKKNHDWVGCWGHHMKSVAFRSVRESQKLNHFPGSFQIGRKDRLWRNLSKMQARFGRKEFNFFPQSFVLPQDIKLLRKAWEEGGTRQKWIVKPPASARGMGIQVIHKWSQLPKKRPLLVQRYLHKPYLISGSKFDLRIYVYVTSYDPLRVYLFTDGLVRFASCKYSSSMKSLSNKFMHLTNYSVNKKNADYKANADETACQGHKWALKALWTFLNQKGFSSEKIWEKIKEMVIKTIIASEPYVNSLVKMYVQNPRSCHELFGFDIMLDENLKPWVLEVNISPSLHSNSPLDVNIKGQMIRDLLNLAGFLVPNKEEMSSSNGTSGSASTSGSAGGRDRVRSLEIQNEERMKRAHYLCQKLPDKDLYATVLEQLTPEDVRVLAETEDELSRCGQFERVFPSPISSRYLRFFEQQRYFNILTNQWEQKYYNDRERGRELLRNLCLNFHSGSVLLRPSPAKSAAPGALHLNGFIRGDVAAPSSFLISPEEIPLTSSSHHLQSELQERTRLCQSLSSVPEPTLVT